MGRRRMGRRSGHPHPPYPPPPRVTMRATAPPPVRHLAGGGKLCKKENSRVHSRAGKSLVPNPFPSTPRRLTLGARGRRSVRARLCAPNSARRGRGKEGAGLQPPHRPPPSPAPRLHVGRPPCTGDAHSPRRSPGCPSPGPGVPARTNFLRVASPTRPTALARPGVTDASETDFPLFQRKGELARAPQPSPSGPRPRPPPPAVTRRPPVPLRRRGGGGGCRRLATCTFETKQTRSPRAHPAAGHRPPSPRLGSLGADPPPKGSRTSLPLPRHPAPELSGRDAHTHTHTPRLTHPLSHAPGRRPRPRPAAPRNFPSCPRAPTRVSSPPASRTYLPRRLSGPRGLGGVRDGPAGAGGRRGSAPRTCRV